jgi:hypothetical protein
MSVDEISRIRLAQSAVKVLGEAEAMTLMEHLPIGGIANLATKDDLALTRAELRADFAELRGEFGSLRGEFGELKGEFGSLRGEFGELKGEFGSLRGDFGDLRAYIEERSHRQTITFIGTMTGIMGLMMAFSKWA